MSRKMQVLFWLLLGLVLSACWLFGTGCGGDDDDNDDAADDDNGGDDDDNDDNDDASPATTPVPTTLDVTLIPVPEGNSYVLGEGPGEPHEQRNDLGATPYLEPGEAKRLSMSYFTVFTDLHQTDEEAPTRLTFFDSNLILGGTFNAAFRPQEDLGAQQLNALVRTANRLQSDYGRDFDLALSLGDSTDNGQLNELRQLIDVFDGNGLASGKPGYTRVDSGDLDLDPDTGLDRGERDFGIQETDGDGNNIDAFNRSGYPNSNADVPTPGLLRSDGDPLPWFSAIGNHDVLATGNFEPDTALTFFKDDDFTGDLSYFGYIPGLASAVQYWEANPDQPLYIGNGLFGMNLDWRLVFQVAKLAGQIPDNYLNDLDPRFDLLTLTHDTPGDASDDGVVIASDPDRAFLYHDGVMQMLHAQGHGFVDRNSDGKVNGADGGYYRIEWSDVRPEAPMPVRILMLDSCEETVLDDGGIGETQLAWLADELDQAAADEVLVILGSHHSVESTPQGGEELTALLNSYENVILHLVGHGHDNKIVPHPDPEGDPLFGYWEVETPSAMTFPQQAHIVELVDNRDGTASIYLTLYDHWSIENDDADKLSELGRELAFEDELIGGYDGLGDLGGMGSPEDRNRELLVQLPENIADKLAEIESDEPVTSAEVLGTLY
ncbi:MAG: hypothetical protein GX444_02600 [Myxococcales bacterium]|nr:hypothetical protein [Myxococcales bacterium]